MVKKINIIKKIFNFVLKGSFTSDYRKIKFLSNENKGAQFLNTHIVLRILGKMKIHILQKLKKKKKNLKYLNEIIQNGLEKCV